jgi:hypothetical protein
MSLALSTASGCLSCRTITGTFSGFQRWFRRPDIISCRILEGAGFVQNIPDRSVGGTRRALHDAAFIIRRIDGRPIGNDQGRSGADDEGPVLGQARLLG